MKFTDILIQEKKADIGDKKVWVLKKGSKSKKPYQVSNDHYKTHTEQYNVPSQKEVKKAQMAEVGDDQAEEKEEKKPAKSKSGDKSQQEKSEPVSLKDDKDFTVKKDLETYTNRDIRAAAERHKASFVESLSKFLARHGKDLGFSGKSVKFVTVKNATLDKVGVEFKTSDDEIGSVYYGVYLSKGEKKGSNLVTTITYEFNSKDFQKSRGMSESTEIEEEFVNESYNNMRELAGISKAKVKHVPSKDYGITVRNGNPVNESLWEAAVELAKDVFRKDSLQAEQWAVGWYEKYGGTFE